MNIIPWLNKREDRETGAAESPIARLRNEMDSLFDHFLRDPWGIDTIERFGRGFGPRVDLAETESEVTVKAELPGIDPKDVDVQVVGNTLTLRGEKRQESEDKRRDYHYVERQYGTFSRTITLPATVDADKVEAEFRNGVLTVTIAKRPDARPKRITVKSA